MIDADPTIDCMLKLKKSILYGGLLFLCILFLICGYYEVFLLNWLNPSSDSELSSSELKFESTKLSKNNKDNGYYEMEYNYYDKEHLTLKKLKSDPEECSRVEAGRATKEYPKILNKTIFNGTKFYFIVGLEGTGHHFFYNLCNKDNNCKAFDWVNEDFSKEFNILPRNYLNYKHGLFGSYHNTIKNFENHRKLFKKGINDLKLKYKPNFNENELIFLNAIGGRRNIGLMSYPNFHGKCKILQYPDIRIIAELFEEALFDLKVIVLTRKPIEIILSTTVKRSFMDFKQACITYTQLIDEVIYKQLNSIDKSFYSCLNYNKLPNLENDFLDFLKFPRIKQTIKTIYKPINETKQQILVDKYKEYMNLKEFKRFNEISKSFDNFCYT